MIEAIAEIPDGPPLRFKWRRVLHEIAAIEGPERIAAEWWRNDALTRDYFHAEDTRAAASGSIAKGSTDAKPPAPNGSCTGCSGEGGEGGVMIRAEPRFAELAAATNFSFLRGASHPEELVAQAARLGLAGIGIADRNSLAGVVRAHVFARENKAAIGALRVVTGARLAFTDGTPDILAYPRDRAAYGRLCRLLTKGNLRAPKGQCHLTLDDLVAHAQGLQIVVMEEASVSFLRGAR